MTTEEVSGDLVPMTLSLDAVERMLLDTSLRVEEDPEAAAVAIIERILSAKDKAQVFASSEVVHAKDIVDEPFNALTVRWVPSTYDDGGAGIYAAVDCVNDDGESFVLTIGARQAMAQLAWMLAHNELPNRFVIRQKAKPTKAGFYPLWLDLAGEATGKPDF